MASKFTKPRCAPAVNGAHAVCWDTTDNGVRDITWQRNATATRRVTEFPEPGTYYWPFDLMVQPALRATLSERP